MSKCIRIDEFGTYIISDNIFGECDDWDRDYGINRTENEYIISNDAKLNGR